MAVTFPYVRAATWADGSTTDTAAKRNTMEDGIFNAHQAPAVRVTHNAGQTITTSVETTLAFNTERFDQAGGAASTQHDTVTNNSRLTALYAGIYLIGASLRWSASPNNGIVKFRVNGATLIGTEQASGLVVMNANTVYQFAVNDYVEVRVFQDSGSNKDISVSANESPEFWMVRVG